MWHGEVMCITNWLVQLSRTTGRQSCGLSSVTPPLWSRLMVPFISSTVITLAFSTAGISLAHALSTSSSACDIVFTHSFMYPSGPGDLCSRSHAALTSLNLLSKPCCLDFPELLSKPCCLDFPEFQYWRLTHCR